MRVLTRRAACAPPSLPPPPSTALPCCPPPADGVICCNRFGRLEEDKLENLRSVVERTGASVVLSTDWRRTPRLKARLCAILAEYGIRVIGATMQGPPQRPVRPREIVSWLEGYETERAKQHQSHAPVSAWVAGDDRFLLFEEDGEAPLDLSRPTHCTPPAPSPTHT